MEGRRDVLRELALSISIKEKFGVVHDGGEEMKECNARLSLTNAYVGKQLCFSTGFLKLTSLRIRNFPQLNEIIIENGVMPNLKSLDIISCMELNTVPKGIEYLQNLQELVLASVLMEL